MAGLPRPEAILDAVTDGIVAAISSEARVSPAALLLLLRRYASGARPDLAASLGDAFARELDRQAHAADENDPVAWLAVFGQAAGASDDRRLADAGSRLVPLVRRQWSAPDLDALMRSVESCLLADPIPEARAVTADAVDSLERAIAATYRPGAGVSHQVAQTARDPFVRGNLADHAYTASTLVTAYAMSGRLPYAMLADELMRSVLRAPVDDGASFATRCDAARVQCRLAALHREPEYRRTAVLPPGADYLGEAEHALGALAHAAPPDEGAAATFGLALEEWLRLCGS